MMVLGALAFLLMGLTLGLIGGGGSILTVPILVYIFQQNPLLATANSLFIVGATAAVGGLQFLYKKQVDLKTVLLFSVPSFVGVYFVRKIILPSIPDVMLIGDSLSISKSHLVMLSFSVIMLMASLKMIKPSSVVSEKKLDPKLSAKLIFNIIFNGLAVGSLAGFVGAGGGFLIIPALTVLLNLPMRIAVGSSLLIIATQSLLGFGFSSDLSQINWSFLITQVLIAIVGIFIGAYINKFVPEKKLKEVFGYFVLFMGSIIIIEQIIEVGLFK
jgi:uncharacterized protein